MKPLRILPLLILGAAALMAASLPPTGQEFEEFVVKRGQTASYIAFQKYGVFNDSIVALLKTDNPELSNLDQIHVGQTLRLRKPATGAPQVQAKRNPGKTVQLASRRAVVTLATGSGTIRRANGTTEVLAANRFLLKGDAITTGPDGYAEIVIDNQSVLRLHRDTEIRLNGIQEPRAATAKDQRPFVTRLALIRGRTWTHVQKWAGGIVNYQIQLPTAIAGVHGTVFETEVAADSSGSVGVVEGEVGVGPGATPEPPRRSLAPKAVEGPKEVAIDEWIRLVRTGMKLSVPKSGLPGEPKAWKPTEADWNALTSTRESLAD